MGLTKRTLLSVVTALALTALAAGDAAAPEVYLSIRKGFGEKVIVAVPLFAGATGSIDNEAMRETLSRDLRYSGHLSLVENLGFVDETEADDRRTGRVAFPNGWRSAPRCW